MTALQRAIAHPAPVPGMRATSPVAGLDRRSVGAWDVLGQSVAAVAPAAASTTIPVLVAHAAGGATLPAVVAATLLAGVVAVAINVFARRLAATGSLYTFVARSLGPRAGVVAGVALLVGYAAIAMFALTGAVSYLGLLVGRLGMVVTGRWWGIVAIAAVAAPVLAVTLWGARRSTRVTFVLESTSVVLIVALLTVVLVRTGPPDLTGTATDVATPGLVTGTVLALTGFVGFESATALGAEARRPSVTVPRAVTWTVVVSGVLYVVAATVQLSAFRSMGGALGTSQAPANDLGAAFGPAWLAGLLDVAIVISFLACAMASTTAMARILFAMGRERVLPTSFGRTHPQRRVPTVATRAAVTLVAMIPVAAVAVGTPGRALADLTLAVAASGFLTAYVLVCAGAPVLTRRIGEPHWWTTVLGWSGAVLIGAALLTFLVVQVAERGATATWAFVALMGFGTVLGWSWLARRPEVAARVGLYDEPTAQDVLGRRS